MTRLMKTLVLAMLCSGLAALPATAQTHSQLQAQINALQAQMGALQGQMATLQQAHMAQMATLQSLINGVAADIPDCMTTALGAGAVDDVIFKGCNVHVQNGHGGTDSSNGVGNLIIGYNEIGGSGSPARSGSHNVVIGPGHSYSSYGGLVTGWGNTVSGEYSSVSGGQFNKASGWTASVSGGSYNVASGYAASVSGGQDNTASGDFAILPAVPDCMTTAPGAGAVDDVIFTGCDVHVQNGHGSTDSNNGLGNLIIGYNEHVGSLIRNGSHNVVIGSDHSYSSYGGLVAGYSNTVSEAFASVSGGKNNTASGVAASVSGGYMNEASGDRASVSGGSDRTASGLHNWRAGGLSQSN